MALTPGTGEIVGRCHRCALGQTLAWTAASQLSCKAAVRAGETLVTDPSDQAVGFTGALAAARALFDLLRQYAPEPNSVSLGELAVSIRCFVLPKAAAARGADLGRLGREPGHGARANSAPIPGIAIVGLEGQGRRMPSERCQRRSEAWRPNHADRLAWPMLYRAARDAWSEGLA